MSIDLRSDTVTRPGKGMRAAMARAEVGDDVYGEDPTVNRLEEAAADRLGTAGALFCASGTQANLIALLCHCQRGEEVVLGQQAHTFRYEGGGAAALGSIHSQPLDIEDDGSLDLGKVAASIKPDDVHFPRTRLLCLENTSEGRALPLDYLAAARRLTVERGLALHLDGARLFNAAVHLGVPAREIGQHFDSVAFCISKGLGAPVGSLLCGGTAFVSEARRWRKMLGGGMRQAGILAAAGLYALEHHVERLAEDHHRAQALARGLRAIGEITVAAVQTNMVHVEVDDADSAPLIEFLRARNIRIQGERRIRLVTHLDVGEEDVLTVIQAFKAYYSGR